MASVAPEEFDNWITPARAVEILSSAFGADSHDLIAKTTLLEALQSGLVTGVAKTSTYKHTNQPIEFEIIPRSQWGRIDTDNMIWTTSHASYRYGDSSTFSGYREVSRFNIRVNPDGVQSLLPPATLGVPPRLAASASDASQPEEKGLPVSTAHLAVWYEAYRKIYGGTATDTEPNAVALARAMFPGKQVSREAVRKLRGSQKPGPKGPRNSDK